MEGQCQCGQIRFTTPLDRPLKLYICHCWNCRHQSSALFGVTASFPHFKIDSPLQGAISTYTRPNSTGKTVGYFCSNCGSRLLHEHIDSNGQVTARLSVKAGCLDGLTKDDYKNAVHIWTSRAVVEIPADVEQYAEEPPE